MAKMYCVPSVTSAEYTWFNHRAKENAVLMYHTLKAIEKRIEEIADRQGWHGMDSELAQIKDVIAPIEEV